MSRGRGSTEDSLDLLLDTICNTFGGVLFIALLVVILVNMTHERVEDQAPDPQRVERLAEARVALAKLAAEAARFSDVLDAQEDFRDLVSPEAARIAAQLQALERENLQRIAERAREGDQLAQAQQHVNQLAAELQRKKELAERVRSELQSVTAELDQEQKKRTEKVALPKAREVKLAPAIFIVANQRMYSRFRLDGFGRLHGTDDVAEVPFKGESYLEPQAGKGVALSAQGDNAAALQRITAFPKSQFFASVAVFKDSWNEAVVLQRQLRARSLPYDFVFFNEGEKIMLTSGDGDAAKTVQ